MTAVNGISPMDYGMVTQNNQTEQIPSQNDYSSMPMVYEPEMEEKKKSSSNMLGLVALGTIALGTSIYAYKQSEKFQQLAEDAAKIIKENETLKAGTQKAEEGLKKAGEKLTEIGESCNKLEETVGNLKAGAWFGKKRVSKEGHQKLKNTTTELKEKIANANDDVQRAIDDLAQNAEKAADDVVENAV